MPASPTEGIPRPTHPTAWPLSLLRRPLHGTDVAVTGITAASNLVRPGDLFAGVPGLTVHGAQFAADAVRAGAVAVLTDQAGSSFVPAGTPYVTVDDVRAELGVISSGIYGDPSGQLRMLGVTGTSGKTTTTFLMRAGLVAAGRSTGLIGTVATLIGEDEVPAAFTTPEAPELQSLLAVMLERGVTDVAMEVSSHALAMGRVGATHFRAAGFTNLSEDHLDFHGSMEEYFQAKAQLLDRGNEYTLYPYVVTDDEWGRRMLAQVGPAPSLTTTGAPDADWSAEDIVVQADGTAAFRVRGPGVDLETSCAIPGRYNVANVLLALALLHEVGVPLEVAAPAIAAAQVPGRMERIDGGQPFLAVVDYSHKPAAVDGALRALRPLTTGRLIIVLGCGGDRDRGKRPHMGEIAARGADLLIVTDDNPRSEDPAGIRAAMLDGARAVPASQRGEIVEIGDRAEAIAHALASAGTGDTVLVAGKGHETGQEVAGVIHPFDDRYIVRDLLAGSSR